MKPWSVFTTYTLPKPLPSGMVAGGVHVKDVGVTLVGVNGP